LLLLGTDEAGKGPIIGSMFLSGLMIEGGWLIYKSGIGVRDSKLLSPAKRETLARVIIYN